MSDRITIGSTAKKIAVNDAAELKEKSEAQKGE